jgi:opacity protein-like surface antigen
MKLLVANSRGAHRRTLTGATFAAVVAASTSAMAQVPPAPPAPAIPNCTSTQVGPVNNLNQLAAPSSAVAGSLAGAIGNINTILLTQQGSAFVSAPANPAPDQPGGGVWGRAVGGEVTLKSTSTSTGVFTSPTIPGALTNVSTSCLNNQNNNFAGVQIGQDIARLNWGGWNVHLGTTAGFVGSNSNDSLANFGTRFDVPFLGAYMVATHGRFFSDIMVREEFYNISVNNPTLGFNNEPIGARAVSVSMSAGYNFDLGNNWFIEPSGGFIYSKTHVDNFLSPGTPSLTISGVNTINDITSEMGRLSLRAGKTIDSGNVIWQPFGSVSVFHEFADPITSSFTSLNAIFPAIRGGPADFAQTTSTSRVGTYGQYSLGLAAQVKNTGWLGFVRVDYRNGDNIEGWTGNAGLRYQFTPEMMAAVMPTKAPVKARGAYIGPTSWTGFYIGGFAGVDYGTTDMRFANNDGNKVWAAGGIGGGQAGYNYQVNKWVFGIEGDLGAANIKGSRTCGFGNGLNAANAQVLGVFTPAYFACTDRADWVATATARVGYAYERTLLYVKGGAAFTNDRVNGGCIVNPAQNVVVAGANPLCFDQSGASSNGFNTSSNRTGWTLGYGTEFDLGQNWSAKAEYDYIDFGRKTLLISDGTLMSDHPTTSQVKIGVNYRFTPGMVVAKY